MRRLLAQTRKELTQIVRDRLALLLALVLPLILLFLLGKAISLTVTDLPIVVQDLDDSASSRDFTDALRASVTFHIVAWPSDRQPQEALRTGVARGALVIPAHFGRDMARGWNTSVQLLVDATDANTAKLVQGYAGEITRAYAARNAGTGRVQPVNAQVRLWFNPGRESKKFYGPGIFVLGISMFPPLLAALAMSKEGEQKTILQVYVSSISAHEFLLGKIFSLHGDCARRVAAFLSRAVHVFRPAHCRRPYALHSRDHSLCLLRSGVWHVDRRGDSKPGGGDSSGRFGRISAGVFIVGLDFPGAKHPGGLALDIEHYLGQILHRNCA